MPAIRASNLSKTFRVYARPRHRLAEILTRRPWHHEVRALEDVSFTVEPGECLGMIGANGAGKSTLLRLLAGLSRPSSGRLEIQGRLSALLELNSGFHPEFTGRENIRLAGTLLGFSPTETAARTEEIIAFAELGEFIDLPVRTYSSGMFLRLGFAVATAVEPEVLLIDEALAVGDEYFRGKCIHRLREFRSRNQTIVIVSHDLSMVRNLCDRAILLDHGRVIEEGAPTPVLQVYLARAYRTAMENMHGSGALPANALRRGSGEIEITAARMLNAEGRPSRAFLTGDPLTVEFDYFTRRGLVEPLFGLNIFRADGVLAVCTNVACGRASNSFFHPELPAGDEPQPLEPGQRGTVRFHAPANLLMPGAYELSVNVFNGKSGAATPVDEVFAAVRFEVLAGRFDDLGLFLLPGAWSVR